VAAPFIWGRSAGKRVSPLIALNILAVAGCASPEKSDGQFKAEIVAGMHQLVLARIQGLNQAARDLQLAAPSPVGRGWDATLDQQQIAAMTDAWVRTRSNWEQAEGILSCLLPDLDTALDSRYEDMIAPLGAAGDPSAFDGLNVVGMHAIERILFAPGTPPAVIAYEASLVGSSAAAWPATEADAAEFKSGLSQRLVDDTQSLLDRWKPLAIDLPNVFLGITGLMSAQAEKVALTAHFQEESRYSQKTMADLRSNLVGTQGVYALFRPWLETKTYGTALDSSASGALNGLAETYAAVPGDALPPSPASWNPTMPSLADQQSQFGQLYEAVVQAVDPARSGSAVESLNQVAKALGLPEFTGPKCGL
jgi:iron uptake system component EfeO